MNNLIFKYFLFVLCALSFQISYAQSEYENFIPVSPEAAALFKTVNYPINYNTGVPNINIPLHEVSVGNIKIPIALNYHAGGFKINEQATRVGLGWSLSCDIQISQSINGKNDLTPNYGYKNSDFILSTYPLSNDQKFDIANNTKDGSPDIFSYKLLNKSGSFCFRKTATGTTNYTIVPIPYDNIKITFNESDGTFTIIDTDGTTYNFGKPGNVSINTLYNKLDNIENVKSEYTGYIRTTWKCDNIISNNKIDIINFSYKEKTKNTIITYNDKVEYYSDPYQCSYGLLIYGSNEYPLNTYTDYNQVMNSYPFYQISSPKYVKYFWNKTELHVPYMTSQGLVDKTYSTNEGKSKSISDVYGLSLKEITFRGGKISFEGADELNNIKIYDDDNPKNEIKSFYFFQSTQKTFVNNNYTKGTRYLDSLHINNQSETYQKYILRYNSKFDFGSHLKGHDVWGYVNHKTRKVNQSVSDELSLTKKTIIEEKIYDPSEEWNCLSYSSNVEIPIGGDDNWAEKSDENYMKNGILRQIIYPTGGSVDFDFEANQFKESFSSTMGNGYLQKLPQISGGLRIRAINYLDENSNFLNQKYYRYGDLEEGTGILMSHPKLTDNIDSYHFDTESYSQEIIYLKNSGGSTTCYNVPCLNQIGSEKKTTYQPSSSLNYCYPNGSPIYYTKITEYENDLGQRTGKKVYTYFDPEEFLVGSFSNRRNRTVIPETNIPYIKTDWMMGAQKSIETYKYSSESGFKIQNKKSFEYSKYINSNIITAYAFYKKIYNVVSGDSDVSQRDIYQYYSEAIISGKYSIELGKLLLKKETEELYETEGKTTTITDYIYGKLPYLNPTITKTTNTKGETIEIQQKYAYDFNNTISNSMKNNNIISMLFEEIKTNTTKNIELSRKKINYDFINEGYGFYAPKTIQSSVKGGNLKTDLTFNKYDQYGNILEVIGKDQIPTSYLWGYNDLYPVAKIQNINYNSISSNFTSNNQIKNPSSQWSLLSVLDGLRANLSSHFITTFTYKRQVGVTSISDPKELFMFYEYDPIGRLINIKDEYQNVKSHYEYKTNHTIPPFSYNYSIPKMRTTDYKNAKFINSFYDGGTQISLNVSPEDYSDDQLDDIADAVINPFYSYNLTDDSLAAVELFYDYYDYSGYSGNINIYEFYPTEMEFDLIENNSIIATQKLQPYNTFTPSKSTNLVIPEGTYTLSFRMDADVKYDLGYIMSFTIKNIEDNTTQFIDSGDSFTFEKGKHYQIRASNYVQ
ncbi:hypothetical protein QVZ41_14320 [Wenyingzhuangia sp. chi5]|uniref:YD repeat-containing protein n=1 Tax=Wenyingzhuangia gilva TaxID=3057677 RepID=A0ABT8VVM1_9FLAO|nr:hypothetical protein [Wenyingzhuangia sp. chi5]MDO3696024.1 hypothetical protein [Wenyingzhuangia sp. chi5]